ncbi:MAG: 2-amino-4-oxopentanoate thiolase subunit OrtA [Sedimenticola sp.]
MDHLIKKGTWVEIERIVLKAAERAPQVPDDTRQLPLVMRVKGFLVESAAQDDMAVIETVTGRRLKGLLVDASPRYAHSFGEQIPELNNIASEVRALLSGGEAEDE